MNTPKPELIEAARIFGEALRETRPLREYDEATTRMAADEQATALLDELQRVQANLRVRQNTETVPPEDIAELRLLQSRVQAHPTIVAFMEAQLRVQAYLPAVNRELTDLLGMDLAALGRVSGCC